MIKRTLPITIAVVIAAIGLCVALIITLGMSGDETNGPARPVAVPSVAHASESSAGAPTKKDRNPSRNTSDLSLLNDAAEANKYAFFFFFKSDDEQTRTMRKVFDETMSKVSDRAETVAVRTGDPNAREIVKKYGVNRAPMPLVLAVAPNGAVTGGFPGEFTEEQLLTAFVGPSSEKCFKALQQRKLTLLCVQNNETSLNEEAMRGVWDLKADLSFKNTTEIVLVDPSDPAEKGLLENLKVNPELEKATTIVLAPPGTAIATFEGATDRNMLVAAIQKASSGSGCGPNAGSGCCPPKKK